MYSCMIKHPEPMCMGGTRFVVDSLNTIGVKFVTLMTEMGTPSHLLQEINSLS